MNAPQPSQKIRILLSVILVDASAGSWRPHAGQGEVFEDPGLGVGAAELRSVHYVGHQGCSGFGPVSVEVEPWAVALAHI